MDSLHEAAIDELAKDEMLDPGMFKSLLKSFCFAVPVCVLKVKNMDFSIEADCLYYIPSMRPSKATNGPLSTCSTHLVYLVSSLVCHFYHSIEAYKTASTLVVNACTAAMEDVKKSVDDLEYYFLLRCTDSDNHQFNYRRIDKDAASSTCDQCSEVKASDTNTVLFRDDWESAIFKMVSIFGDFFYVYTIFSFVAY